MPSNPVDEARLMSRGEFGSTWAVREGDHERTGIYLYNAIEQAIRQEERSRYEGLLTSVEYVAGLLAMDGPLSQRDANEYARRLRAAALTPSTPAEKED